jgi:hypothetical protein
MKQNDFFIAFPNLSRIVPEFILELSNCSLELLFLYPLCVQIVEVLNVFLNNIVLFSC